MVLRNELMEYSKALWKHWRALVSGVGSIILSALSAYLKIALPYWSFGIVAICCFFAASFLAWRDEQGRRLSAEAQASAAITSKAELERRQTQKYSSEQIQVVHKQLANIPQRWQRVLLQELLLRGQMQEAHASDFLRHQGFGIMNGALNNLEYNTNLVSRDFVGNYTVNAHLRDAIAAALEEEKTS